MAQLTDTLTLWFVKLQEAVSPSSPAKLNAKLSWAQERGSEGIVRYLLDKGADANYSKTGSHPLLIDAANAHQTGIISALLEHGAKVDAKGPDGTTALMCSADLGDLRSATVLMTFNADVTCRNAFNKTAFDYASEADNWNAVLEWKLKFAMAKTGAPAPPSASAP